MKFNWGKKVPSAHVRGRFIQVVEAKRFEGEFL